MAVRLLLAAITLLGVALATVRVDPALGAPGETGVSPLSFSTSVNDLARPEGQSILFPTGTNKVWVSFDYRGHEQGRKIAILLKRNNLDFRYFETTCCAGVDGRYAYPLDGLAPGSEGAGYEVVVFDNGQDAGRGFFAVASQPNQNDLDNDNGGGGNDNNLSNSHGNDNGGNDND